MPEPQPQSVAAPLQTSAPRFVHLLAPLLVGLAVMFVCWLLFWQLPRSPLINPDSLGNLLGSWHRNIGYPLFLDVIYRLTGNLYAVVVVQALAVMGALVFAFFQVGAYYRRPMLGLLASIPFLLSTTLIQYYLYIWTEAVFIALCLLTIGAFFSAMRRPRRWSLVLCGLAAGASIAIKPIGLTLVLFPFVLLLQLKGQRSRVLVFSFVLYLLPVVAYMHYNDRHLGSPSPFLRGGMSLFAGTAHLHPEDVTGEYASITAWLRQDTEPFRQQLRQAERYRERQEVKKRQHANVGYARGQFEGMRKLLAEMAAASPERYCADEVQAPESTYYGRYHPGLCVDNLQKQIAVNAIAAAPIGYLAYVADNLYAYMRETYRHTKLNQRAFDERRGDAYAIAGDFNLNAPRSSFAAAEAPPVIDLVIPINRVHSLLHTKIVFGLRVYEILGLAGGLIMILCTLAFAWVLVLGILSGRVMTPLMVGAGTLNATLLGMYLMMALTHHVVIRYVDILQPVAALAAILGAILVIRFVAAKPFSGPFPIALFLRKPEGVV